MSELTLLRENLRLIRSLAVRLPKTERQFLILLISIPKYPLAIAASTHNEEEEDTGYHSGHHTNTQ